MVPDNRSASMNGERSAVSSVTVVFPGSSNSHVDNGDRWAGLDGNKARSFKINDEAFA